eukprot:gene20426-biopygen16114
MAAPAGQRLRRSIFPFSLHFPYVFPGCLTSGSLLSGGRQKQVARLGRRAGARTENALHCPGTVQRSESVEIACGDLLWATHNVRV